MVWLGQQLARQASPKFILQLRFAIPREKRGIEEFDDEEFLTRKTDEENGRGKRGIDRSKKDLFREKYRKKL